MTDVYLDHAGIGIVGPAARAAMVQAVDEVLAAGSAAYDRFFAVRTQAREWAAQLMACSPDELALVANTSTGLQLVADGLDWRTGDEIVVFAEDFPANIQPWRRLGNRGVSLRWVPMHDGGHRLADVEAAIGLRTRLVAASHVHFRTGFRLDLDALCALAHRHSVLVCVDAIQSLGALPLDLSATPVDFLAAGGHKWLGGPPGTGVFFCRGTRLDLLAGAPLGWFGYQDSDLIFGQGPGHLRYDLAPRPAARRFEGGMLNFVGLAGLAAALEEVVRIGPATIWTRVAELAGRLRRGLATRGYQLALPEDAPGSGIVSFRPPDPDHDPHNAATPLSVDPAAGHTDLLAAGYRCSYPDGWIRLSPHHTTSDADIESVLEFLAIDRSKY